MAKSLKKMEEKLETVLQSISNPAPVASTSYIEPNVATSYHSPSPYGMDLGMDNLIGDRMRIPSEQHYSNGDDRAPINSADAVGVRFESGLGRQGMQWGRKGSDLSNNSNADSPRLHSLPDNTLNPLGLLAEASLQNARKRALPSPLSNSNPRLSDDGSDEDDGEGGRRKKTKLGVANTGYFQPGPMNILPLRRIVIEQRMPPALLVEKILTIEEVVELFALYV